MRRSLAPCFIAPFVVMVASCGGSDGNADLFGAGDVVARPDAAPPAPEAGGPPPSVDAGPVDAGPVDAGLTVNELPEPDCHDLEPQGALVASTANPSPPPAQTMPLTAITPGLYGVTSIVDYGGTNPQQGSSRTTVFFTATKQYYASNGTNGNPTTKLTMSWKLANGRLSRTILCGRGQGNVVEYRIDASPNGFTTYVPLQSGSGSGRFSAYRYERLD
ncbi:MAG: hypothetical protein KF819_20135 [Labilithrix sp.]|nr:hypothetical protein [Labilithrix sp.]